MGGVIVAELARVRLLLVFYSSSSRGRRAENRQTVDQTRTRFTFSLAVRHVSVTTEEERGYRTGPRARTWTTLLDSTGDWGSGLNRDWIVDRNANCASAHARFRQIMAQRPASVHHVVPAC